MKENKDQFVIACLEKATDADIVMPTARHFAARLGKGLIVLNVSKDGDNEWIKQYSVPYIGLKGDWKTAIDGLSTAFGGVLAVTAVDLAAPRSSLTNPATLLKTFRDCKIAYLVVSEQWSVNSELTLPKVATDHSQLSTLNFPLSTLLTLDHRRESKEKLIWASYMVRFLGSRLTVATPDYKDEGFREKLRNNLLSLKKFYTSLGIEYSTKKIPSSNFKSPDLTLTENSPLSTLHSQLLIAMTTDRRERDLADMLTGTPELRLLKTSQIPILLLNQRDDLYVLCD